MTVIKQADLIESVAAALQYISYYHPADYIQHLARAYDAKVLIAQTVIHVAFLLSAMAIAYTDRLTTLTHQDSKSH